MHVPSIEEVLAVHRACGHRHLDLQPRAGEFDVACFDVASGKRLWREVRPNLVTRALSDWFSANEVTWGNTYVFLAPDTKPAHVLKTTYRSTWAAVTGSVVASTFDVNLTSRLWTITGTILAPAAGKTRTFQTVGVTNNTKAYYAYGNSSGIAQVFAATRLSAQRVQDETQQVVISYRLAWEEGHNV